VQYRDPWSGIRDPIWLLAAGSWLLAGSQLNAISGSGVRDAGSDRAAGCWLLVAGGLSAFAATPLRRDRLRGLPIQGFDD
jgi:hypothetical protein